MDRRERLLGIAEKVPKKIPDDNARRKVVLEGRRAAQAPLTKAAAKSRAGCRLLPPLFLKRVDDFPVRFMSATVQPLAAACREPCPAGRF